MKATKMCAGAAVLMAVVLLVVGCGGQTSMVGRWDQVMGGQVVLYYEFDRDEEFLRFGRSTGLFGDSYQCVDQGIWKVEGDAVYVAHPGLSPKEPLFRRLDRSQFQWELLGRLVVRDGRPVLEFPAGRDGARTILKRH